MRAGTQRRKTVLEIGEGWELAESYARCKCEGQILRKLKIMRTPLLRIVENYREAIQVYNRVNKTYAALTSEGSFGQKVQLHNDSQ